MKTIITTEKPSVAKDFSRALNASYVKVGERLGYYENEQYVIAWCYGHMVRTKNPGEYKEEWQRWSDDLLVPDPFEKVLIERTQEQSELLISLINREDIELIVNAGDAGREGEGIQRELYDVAFERLGKDKPIKRFWTSEVLSREIILSQLSSLLPGEEFNGLNDACAAREQSDWIVGINATRTFTYLFGGQGLPLSIGRVQTPTLALIVRREEEIRNFVPAPFHNLVAKSTEDRAEDAEAAVVAKAIAPEDERGDRFAFWSRDAAEAMLKDCQEGHFIVTSVTEKEKREYPPRLFSMPSLQEHCNRSFGWAPDQTLKLAQSLYEKRFQTYPRTDSEVLGNAEKKDHLIKKRADAAATVLPNGDKMVAEMLSVDDTGSRIFNQKKLTDHHAIIPSDLTDTSCQFDQLTKDEQTLFRMVAGRFIQAFLPPAIYAHGEAELECNGHPFLARAKRCVDPGWKKFKKEEHPEKVLNLSEGEEIDMALTIEDFETSAPKRFTQGDVIHAMTHAHRFVAKDTPPEIVESLKDTDGIGTGATRDSFLPLLVNRGYVEIKRNTVYPLERGMDLIRILGDNRITDFIYTAVMENKLKKIADNESAGGKAEFIVESIEFAREILEFARSQKGKVFIAGNVWKNEDPDCKVVGICPDCGGDIVPGKKGFGCTNWRNGCKFTIWFDCLEKLGHGKITASELKKLLAPDSENWLRFKNSGYGAEERLCKLEKLDGRWSVRVDFETTSKKETMGTCPACEVGGVVETPKAWSCDKYKETGCNFTIWKTSLEKLGHKEITATEIKSLLNGVTELRFKSKDYAAVDRKCEIEKRGEYYGVKVDFENAKKESVGECLACGGEVVETPKAWSCSTYKETGCRFTIWKNSLEKLGHAEVTATEIKKLLKGPHALRFKSKDYPTEERTCEIEKRGEYYGIKVDFDSAKKESMGECHACGGAVVETPKAWSCSTYKETGCRFTIWKDSLDKLGHSAITATEIKKLLKKEETWLKFQKKDYPTIDRLCEIEVRGDRYGIKIDFEGEGRPEILGTCPICSAEMIESPKAFNCRGNNQQDCNFTIWKNCLERFNGKLLTKVQLKKLLKDQKIPVEIRNKEGEKQTVNLLIDEKYGVKIDFAGSKKQGDTPS